MFSLFLVAFAAVARADDYTDFLNGFLTTLEPALGGQVGPCLRPVDGGINEVEAAIQLITNAVQQKNFTALFYAFRHFEKALADLSNAASACNEGVFAAKLRQLVLDIRNDPWGVFIRLVPHSISVWRDAHAAVTDYRAHNLTACGMDIGGIFAILIKTASRAHVVKAAPAPFKLRGDPMQAYVDFLNGVLTQLEPALGASNISACITPTDGGFNDVAQGFQLLWNGLQTGNVTALFQAASYLETALADIKNAAVVCNEPQFAAAMAALLQELQTDPIATLLKLLPYGGQVTSDLTAAVAAFKAQNFTGAGNNVGAVLAILVQISAGTKRNLRDGPTQAYIDFLNGVLSTLAPALGAGNVSSCLTPTDGAFDDVYNGFQLLWIGLQTGNMTALFQAASYLESSLVDIHSAAVQCKEPQFAAAMAALLQELQTDPVATLIKLLPHGFQITSDLTAAVAAFKTQNFSAAGSSIGDILAILVQVSADAKVGIKINRKPRILKM